MTDTNDPVTQENTQISDDLLDLISTQETDVDAGEAADPEEFVRGLLPDAISLIETALEADLVVRRVWSERVEEIGKRGRPLKKLKTVLHKTETRRDMFLSGHKIDYVKEGVAFDLEWNSKDQTFDRDLNAFAAFAQCGIIDAGVLVTRSRGLNTVFKELGILGKYGASTTWMGKLLKRLDAGRNGACPVLAIGITEQCISD